jgi:hypothetical protein
MESPEADAQAVLEHGLEALEQKFGEAEIEYWDPARPSVA